MAGKIAKKPKAAAAEKETSGAASASSSTKQRQRAPTSRPRSGGCCPGWFTWIVLPLVVFGLIPAGILYLPAVLPPLSDVRAGTATMTGGPGFIGASGLLSTLQAFGTEFCAEHGSRDTVSCHVSVLRAAYLVLTGPALLDFYTVLPAAALQAERKATYAAAASPLVVNKQWTEVVADPAGVNPSQVAAVALDLLDASRRRLPPVATGGGAAKKTLEELVAAVPCQGEFERIFGEPRRARAEEGTAVWARGEKRVVYVFGLEAAIQVLGSLPAALPEDGPVNVVLYPSLDYGYASGHNIDHTALSLAQL